MSTSFLFSCKKDDDKQVYILPKINKPPQDFTIVPEIITGSEIVVSYSESYDPEYQPVKYRYYLNDSMIGDNQDYTGLFKFDHLLPETIYKINITSVDTGGLTNSQIIYTKSLHAGAEISHNKFWLGGREREYGLYLPTGSDNQKLPLVIFLHGAAGIIWPKMINYHFTKLAEREKFIFLQPQALPGSSENKMTGWDAHNLLPWNDVDFINSIIDTLNKKGQVDLSRIYVSGMSNGGFMTFTVAEELQDKIAAIAPIAGLMDNTVFSNYNMRKPLPLCYIHGTADATVEIEGDGSSVGWSRILTLFIENNNTSSSPLVVELPDINKNDNSTVTKFEYHSYSGKSDILFYRINNGVHSIPGIEYPANMDINAFEEIWKFFKDYTL